MSLAPDLIDSAPVLQELQACFDAYEAAFMANDVKALNAFFWEDPRTTRYGIQDRQWGHDELVAYRTATPAPNFTRRLEHLRLHAYGPDHAVAQVEFVRSDTALRGFQTQTWVRFPQGWRIVSAHVSMIPWNGG